MKGWIAIVVLLASPVAMAQKPDLAGIGTNVRAAGNAEVARKEIAAALEYFQKENQPQQVAACYLLLGLVDFTLGREDSTRTNLAQAIERFGAMKDHFGSVFSMLVLAEFEKQQLNFDVSLATYEKAIALTQRLASSDEPVSLDGIMTVAAFFGFEKDKLPQLPSAEIFRPILIMMIETMLRVNYGSSLVEAGELVKAEAQLTQARSMAVMFGPMFESSLSAHFGDLRRRQWRLDEARSHFRKALQSTSVLPPFSLQGGFIEVEIIDKLADVEVLCGRVDEAMAWNDKALALIGRSNEPLRDAAIFSDRGDLLFRTHRYEAAEAAFDDALKVAEDAGDTYLRGTILTGLGQLNFARGQYGTAAMQLEQSIALLAKMNSKAAQSRAWMVLSEIYSMTGAPDNATLALGKARELAARSDSRVHVAVVELAAAVQKLTAGEGSAVEVEQAVRKAWALPEASGAGMSPMVIEVLAKMGFLQAPDENVVLALSEPGNPAGMSCVVSILQGKALMEKKEFAAARAVWKKGLDTCPSRDLRAGFSAMMGVAWVHEGNLEQASRSLLEAANALELAIDDIRIEEMLSNFLGDRGIYFNVLVEMLVRQGRIEEAFDFTERARARAFLQLIGRARLEPRRGADAQLAGEAETLRTQIADWERESFTVPEATARRIRTDLREARLRYEALLTRLKSTSSEYASLSSIKPLTIDDVRASLPPDTTMISYFQTPWSVQAWVIDQKTLHHAVLPMPLSSLQRASCWAGQVGERSVEVLDEPGRCSEFANPEEVYEQLFAPLRSKIANHRLVIVPHGPLHYIPFAALRDAKRKRYLVEDFTITYAPSASSLRFLSEKESGVDGTALVLGNPIGMNGSDLPNAVWEAVRASEALGTRPLLGERAMESRLYELNGKVDLVHIAAHGTYDDKHPLFSRITLAPGDGRDGNLEVHDILGELDLSGVNLVVLAACDSALGKRSGGDDIVGLTRALLYAGTPGVISTLWRINDEATATLMDEFYCRLLAGDLAADALRTAQLTMLKSETNADPTKWAAFSLTGNPMGRWSTSH